MSTKQDICAIIEQAVLELGYEFVGVETLPQGQGCLHRVYVDKDNGITVGELQKISRHVEAVLTVALPDLSHYTLELSSPGIDRLLFTLAHFQRFVGNQIKLRLSTAVEGRRRFQGTLTAVEQQQIHLDSEEGEQVFDFSSIEKARLLPDFTINRL